MLRRRAVPALLLAVFAAAPACKSDHHVPRMEERAAVPRTEPMPQAPAGTIYPRPAAQPRDGAGPLAPADPQVPEEGAITAPLQPGTFAPGEAPGQPEGTPQGQDPVDPEAHDGHTGV